VDEVIYEFRVDGRLPEHSRDAFCGMHVEEIPPGLVLRGPVMDDSHLLGIISSFRQPGLAIVSVHPLPAGEARAAARGTRRSAASCDEGATPGEGSTARRQGRRPARRAGDRPDRPDRPD
jgi:hypothetical protein